MPIISSLRKQDELAYQDVHKYIIRLRMSGMTVCQAFMDVIKAYAFFPRASNETLMKSKYSSSVLESLWWELEAGKPEPDISIEMIWRKFEDSVNESSEPKVVLVDLSVAIQSILKHYKRKNLDSRCQEDLCRRLKFGKDKLVTFATTRQRDLDNERMKKQRLADERAQVVESQARRALEEAEKALVAIKPEGFSLFGAQPDTATGGFMDDPSSGLP